MKSWTPASDDSTGGKTQAHSLFSTEHNSFCTLLVRQNGSLESVNHDSATARRRCRSKGLHSATTKARVHEGSTPALSKVLLFQLVV